MEPMSDNRAPWWADFPSSDQDTSAGSLDGYSDQMNLPSGHFTPPDQVVNAGSLGEYPGQVSFPSGHVAPPSHDMGVGYLGEYHPDQVSYPSGPVTPPSHDMGVGYLDEYPSTTHAGHTWVNPYVTTPSHEDLVPDYPVPDPVPQYPAPTVEQVPIDMSNHFFGSAPSAAITELFEALPKPSLVPEAPVVHTPEELERQYGIPETVSPQVDPVWVAPQESVSTPLQPPEEPFISSPAPHEIPPIAQEIAPPTDSLIPANPLLSPEDPWAEVAIEQFGVSQTGPMITEVAEPVDVEIESNFDEVSAISSTLSNDPEGVFGFGPLDEEPLVKTRKHKHHRGLRVTLVTVLSVVLLVGGAIAYVWFDLNGRLNTQAVVDIMGTARPPAGEGSGTFKRSWDLYAGRSVNILVLGTDSREGNNQAVSDDNAEGARSDTTFIAHISANRDRIDIISIPRDTWITIPECLGSDGIVIPEAGWMNMGFNAAFAYGYYSGDTATGAACSMRAVEEMSNVRIDAYAVVDFSGFVDIVDAVNGVDVTLLCSIYAPLANGLDLPEGINHLNGETAVSLARARTGWGLGDGSDLSRIHRQQALINAMLDKLYSMNYVTDFPKLYNLLAAVISSITTDVGSNLAQIAALAYSVKDLDMANVSFQTIPVVDAGNKSNVVVNDGLAEPMWEALRMDKPIPTEEEIIADQNDEIDQTEPSDPDTDLSDPDLSDTDLDPETDPETDPVDTESSSIPTPEPTTTPAGPVVIQRESDCW